MTRGWTLSRDSLAIRSRSPGSRSSAFHPGGSCVIITLHLTGPQCLNTRRKSRRQWKVSYCPFPLRRRRRIYNLKTSLIRRSWQQQQPNGINPPDSSHEMVKSPTIDQLVSSWWVSPTSSYFHWCIIVASINIRHASWLWCAAFLMGNNCGQSCWCWRFFGRAAVIYVDGWQISMRMSCPFFLFGRRHSTQYRAALLSSLLLFPCLGSFKLFLKEPPRTTTTATEESTLPRASRLIRQPKLFWNDGAHSSCVSVRPSSRDPITINSKMRRSFFF